jgi:hypothetical protein
MKYWVFICVLAYSGNLLSQTNIKAPTSVINMMKKYVDTNKSIDEVQGWRIQIVATTDRRLMEGTRTRFRQEFPEVECTWTHRDPYYQVRAGAYYNRKEALPELDRFKKKFPKAYLVVDKIKYDELNKQLQ